MIRIEFGIPSGQACDVVIVQVDSHLKTVNNMFACSSRILIDVLIAKWDYTWLKE